MPRRIHQYVQATLYHLRSSLASGAIVLCLAVIFIPIFVRRRTRKEMRIVGRRKKYPKLPNGYGSIKRLSGKNRTNPYGVYPPTKEFDINGNPVSIKALCYVDDWYKGFTVLTWYKHGEYYPGREKELTESGSSDELGGQVAKILSKYSQTQREVADQKTFEDIFKEFYAWKFGKEYNLNREKRSASEAGFRSAYNNCKSLHDKSFRSLVTADLQKAVDDCPLKHATLEKIIVLFNQMYAYADANDLCDKKYSDYVKIKSEDDDEKGVPFENDELEILWKNQEDPVVEMLLIICYSGFRISEYIDLEINWNENYLKGGLKTDAGRNRIVPIHSAILPLVKRRIKRDGAFLTCSTGDFRTDMYATLEKLGIKKHTPHDCRHTFSKLCDDYYVNETDKKLMLGHSFQDVTNKVYLHRSLERLKEEIERIKVCR